MVSLHWKMISATLLMVVHIIVDYILEWFLGWYLGLRRRCCGAPVTSNQRNIVTKSAVELARLIREREVTSYTVVKAFYDQLVACNRDLNAVVDGPFPEALDQAKKIDQKLERGEYTNDELTALPFLGVPFTTKDSTEVGGKLHTLGLKARKNVSGKLDAECVRLMKASGAIILATSNVPEINKWMESRNMLVGQTNNPYDLRRTVGGSSGGEGALISSCSTAFGLGTDIGGSIRIPAFYCGIFGHKPTTHVVNTRGCTFRTGKEKHTMVVAGPMARSAVDLSPILRVIAGERAASLHLDKKVDVHKLRYFYIPSNNMLQCNRVTDAAQHTMYKIRTHFAELTGVDVQLAQLPGLELSGRMWRYWMTQEPASFKTLLGNGVELNPYVELMKKVLGQSDFTLAAIYGLLDDVLPPEKESLMRDATEKCKRALEQLLGDDGVLFYHSSPRSAPFHYYPLIKFPDFNYFSIFNVLQTPVTQVPMGLSTDGIPLGVQVVAGPMNDRLCLAVAEELERKFGGWVPPFSA